MKISTRVECGIIALIDIDINSRNGEAVTVSNISSRQNISAKYLEQILPALKQANIIRSQKGARGGYVIARPSKSITFKEIINALDITVLSEVTFDDSGNGSVLKSTVNNCLWNKITDFLQTFTQNLTLCDISNQYKESISNSSSEPMYYI